jgi:integrase
MSKRVKTKYAGVFYRESARAGGGVERVYYIVFKLDGRTVEEKVGRQFQDDLTPAKVAGIRAERMEGRRKSRKQVREEQEAERNRMTIGRLWETFQDAKAGNKSIRDDRYRWGSYLDKDFSKKLPSELVTLDVDRLRRKLTKRGLAPATVKQGVVLLKRIINFGVKRGLCPAPDPSRLHFEMPKVNNETTEDLSPDQLESLLQAIEDDPNRPVADMMRLALFSGLRRGELFRLQWGDLDFERGFILLRDPKGGRDQKIPMSPPARELLLSIETTGSPYVFPGRDGKQRSCVKRTIQRVRDRAGLPKTFRPLHGLRHAYASMLASSGKVDLFTLQKLLTHKSPTMTQRYAHLRDDALKRAADVTGEIFRDLEQDRKKAAGNVVNLEKYQSDS